MFHVREAGHGPVVLLIHGGAEDAGMLDGIGQALAGRGFRAIWYDRRGTGGSTRADWPGDGADQHADDALAILRSRDAVGGTVMGFSSGGVVALALAERHPAAAAEVIAWEPAALGMLPGAAEIQAGLMAPIEEYLAANPGDWVGGFHTMLGVLSEGRADLSDPAVKLMEPNAEAALRDDGPLITARGFESLPQGLVTVATSRDPNPLHAQIADRLAPLTGNPVSVVEAADDHEIYVKAPAILADWLASRSNPQQH
ncbi:alpha/beta fold hydrolase [Actinoplanes sp. NPDC051633]|uniref:alpha/beta fold hydrolase n=1 Tax=Actinoplanes sp. NPDC051633 TaxID=3155670 RepID=UPI0034353DE7